MCWPDDYEYYIKRSQHFYNHFDPETKFMRGRFANGRWRSPFDPRQVSHLGHADFTEGNAWQYTFFVPHNVNALMQAMGGREAFADKLDQLFSESELFGLEQTPDVSGLIGNYAHGNEPSHHIAYLYNYAGYPWKTQEIVHRIRKEMYTTQPSGLAGNEDCGQMSAWYIFSAMGFYPVCPGDNRYVIGTPGFEKIVLHLPDGKKSIITSGRTSEDDFYIQKAIFNGRPCSKNFIGHSDLMEGVHFKFILGHQVNETWGTSPGDQIKSVEIEEKYQIGKIEEIQCMPPRFEDEEILFSGTKLITLSTDTQDGEIRYTLDGSDPDDHSTLYSGPFEIDSSIALKARTFKNGLNPSSMFERSFLKVSFVSGNKTTIRLKNEPHPGYNTGGSLILLDKKLGSHNFRDSRWLGFEYDDLDATIDLGKELRVHAICANFFQAHGAWILLPVSLEVQYSKDGVHFESAARQEIPLPESSRPDQIKQICLNFNPVMARYLRIVAQNQKQLPRWHGTPGGKSWIFCDEIMIEAR